MSADVDFDVIVVGAGVAGSVAARQLAAAGHAVALIERGDAPGAKNLSGGVLYTHSLLPLFPDLLAEAPVERQITRNCVQFLTPTAGVTLDYTDTRLAGNAVTVLRARFDPWLAAQAEAAGAEYIYGIAVDELVSAGDSIVGVRAGGDEITAEVTILADGANSLLSEQAGLAATPKPHQMAVGVKEVIELPAATIEDRMGTPAGEGAAWLFVGDATHGHVGGGFLYANKDSLSLGLVATLSDLARSQVPVYQMLADFKQHPAIAPLLAGGKVAEYSGHLIPEGGYAMLPQLYKGGCLVAGDAAMLCINLGYQVRGIDFAMASGDIAAAAADAAIAAGDVTASGLASYKDRLQASFVLKDLQAFRRFPHYMESTTRLFNEYPAMLEQLMLSLFVVDGSPVQPLLKKAKAAAGQVGMMNMLKDVRGAVKAL